MFYDYKMSEDYRAAETLSVLFPDVFTSYYIVPSESELIFTMSPREVCLSYFFPCQDKIPDSQS